MATRRDRAIEKAQFMLGMARDVTNSAEVDEPSWFSLQAGLKALELSGSLPQDAWNEYVTEQRQINGGSR